MIDLKVNLKTTLKPLLSSTFWVTLYHTKPYYEIIRIHRGLTLKLSLFYRSSPRALKRFKTKSKNNYYERTANKQNNLQRSFKPYWFLLKCFLNNKKAPLIPPLFQENEFVTNFFENAELFSSFFSEQCPLINNGNTLPTQIQYLTNNRLSSITFSQDDIAKIFPNIDSGKVRGRNDISRRMLKICGPASLKPLAIIFKQCVVQVISGLSWKRVILFLSIKKAINKHWQLSSIIVKMQNICNLIGWNSVHISDIFNCYRANINGMWNARKLGGIY